MKRDWDVIRHILITVEQYDRNEPGKIYGGIYQQEQRDSVDYHINLLVQAGLINGTEITSQADKYSRWDLTGLSWEGHDLLDAIRSDTVWQRTKKDIVALGAGLSFELIKSHAVSVTLRMLQGVP